MAEYSEANKTLTDIVNGVNSALERRLKIDEVEILKNAGAVDTGAGVYGKFTIEYTSLKKNLDAQFDWIEERRPGKRRFDIGVNTMISGIIGYFISVGNSIDTVTITPKAVDNALDLVISNLREAFGFLK